MDVPATHLKENVLSVLKEEGFILDYQVGEMAPDEQGRLSFRTPPTPARPNPSFAFF